MITQGRAIFTRCSNYEPRPVQQTLTNNLKGFEQKQITNRNTYKNRFVGVCDSNTSIKINDSTCVDFRCKHSPLGESKHSASGASFRRFAEKWLPEGKIILKGLINIKDKETKSERINLHLTPTAKSIIADKASALCMNMTAYITACAIVKDVYVIGDKDTFNDLVYQVKRIGGNINQLRMLSQLGKIECVDLRECTAELDNIRKTLNTIIRKANKWQR